MSLRATVEKAFAAFAAGDIDTAIQQFTPDVVMIEGGANIRTGEYQGREAIKSLLRRLSDETNGSFTATAQAVTGDETMAASVAHAVGWRRGRHLDTHVVTLFAGTEGLISSIRDLPFDWRAWDEFWSA